MIASRISSERILDLSNAIRAQILIKFVLNKLGELRQTILTQGFTECSVSQDPKRLPGNPGAVLSRHLLKQSLIYSL